VAKGLIWGWVELEAVICRSGEPNRMADHTSAMKWLKGHQEREGNGWRLDWDYQESSLPC
jgi:hypothetical protein